MKTRTLYITIISVVSLAVLFLISTRMKKVQNEQMNLNFNQANRVESGTQQEQKWTEYKNDTIGLSFMYPEDWGYATGILSKSENSRIGVGKAFDLHFNDSQGVLVDNAPSGGGRSVDFIDARGAYQADFKGFEGRTAEEFCQQYAGTKSRCDVVSENMVSVLHVPEFARDCPPAPANDFTFYRQVFVNLPYGPELHGFTLHYSFVTLNDFQPVLDAIGGSDGCQSASSQLGVKFNTAVDRVLADLDDPRSLLKSKKNADDFERLVRSIETRKFFVNACESGETLNNLSWYGDFLMKATSLARVNPEDRKCRDSGDADVDCVTGTITENDIGDVCYMRDRNMLIALVPGIYLGSGFKLLRYDVKNGQMSVARREDFDGGQESGWYQFMNKRFPSEEKIDYYDWKAPPREIDKLQGNSIIMIGKEGDAGCGMTVTYRYDILQNYLSVTNFCSGCVEYPSDVYKETCSELK